MLDSQFGSSLNSARLDVISVYQKALDKAMFTIYDKVTKDSLLANPHIPDKGLDFISERVAELVRSVFDNERESAFRAALDEIDRLNSYCFELEQKARATLQLQNYTKAIEQKCYSLQDQLAREVTDRKTIDNDRVNFSHKHKVRLCKDAEVIAALKEELRISDEERKFYKVEIQVMQSDHIRLRDEAKRLELELQLADRQRGSKLVHLEEALKSSKDKEASLKSAGEAKDAQLKLLAQQVKELKRTISDLAKSSESCLVAARQKNAQETQRLRTEIKDMRTMLKEKTEEARKQDSLHKGLVDKLSQQIYTLGERLAQSERSAKALGEEVIALSRCRENLQYSLQSCKQELEAAGEALVKYREQEKVVACERQQLRNAKEQLSRISLRLSESQSESQLSRRKLLDLSDSCSRLSAEKQQLANQHSQATLELGKLKTELEKAKDVEQQLCTAIKTVKGENEVMARRDAEGRRACQQNQQLRALAQNYRAHAQEVKEQCQSFQEQVSGLQSFINALSSRLDQQGEAYSSVSVQLHQTETQLRKAQLNNQALERQVQQANYQEKALGRLTAENKELADSVQMLKERVKGQMYSSERVKASLLESKSKLQQEQLTSAKIRQSLKQFKANTMRKLSSLKVELSYLSAFRQNSAEQLRKLALRSAEGVASSLKSQANILLNTLSYEGGKKEQAARQAIEQMCAARECELRKVLSACSDSNEQVRRTWGRKAADLEERIQTMFEQNCTLTKELNLTLTTLGKYEAAIESMRAQQTQEREELLRAVELRSKENQSLARQNQTLKTELTGLAAQFKKIKKSTDEEYRSQQQKLQQIESTLGRSVNYYEDELKLLQKQLRLQRESSTAVAPPVVRVEEKGGTEADRILSQLRLQLSQHKKQLASWREEGGSRS